MGRGFRFAILGLVIGNAGTGSQNPALLQKASTMAFIVEVKISRKKIKKSVTFVISLFLAGSLGAVASGEGYDELTADS